jgi:hypothetical protein
VPKSWTVEGFDEYLHFPDPADRENKHRGWRKFLGVWARDTDGGLWLLACVHIISGTAGACTPPPNHAGVGASSLQAHALLRRIAEGWGHHHCARWPSTGIG